MADLEMRRDLAAPVDRVWLALADPSALAAWFWPSRIQTTVSTANVVGGRYRIDGSGAGLAVSGEYVERERLRRLAFTWRWDGDPERTLVTIELRVAGDGTQLLLRHAGFADEATRDEHVKGWSDCLDRLPGWLDSAR
jgi:uncharacterized protein YndB with AHSA1/START domain